MSEALVLESLFSTLRKAEYYWTPLSPERWLKCREQAYENPEQFDPWVRCFGLGLAVAEGEFESADLNSFTIEKQGMLSSRWGVSRTDAVFVAHTHWGVQEGTAYIGQETATLTEFMKSHSFQGKKILDLGCGAGALSLSLASQAQMILGLDCSRSATQLAQASARAQGMHHLDFQSLSIGSAAAENYTNDHGPWDVAVMNPPMAIPEFSARPERDGGKFGIELPLLFLDFAHRHLKRGGSLFMLATNPVTKHSHDGLFFEALRARMRDHAWILEESACLNRHFNQSLARKHRYADQGIERIELWYLKLVSVHQ